MQVLPFSDATPTPIDGRSGDSSGSQSDATSGEEVFAALLAALGGPLTATKPVITTVNADDGAVLTSRGDESGTEGPTLPALPKIWPAQDAQGIGASPSPMGTEHIAPSSQGVTPAPTADAAGVGAFTQPLSDQTQIALNPNNPSEGQISIEALGMETVSTPEPFAMRSITQAGVDTNVPVATAGGPLQRQPAIETQPSEGAESIPTIINAQPATSVGPARLTLIPDEVTASVTPRVVVFSREADASRADLVEAALGVPELTPIDAPRGATLTTVMDVETSPADATATLQASIPASPNTEAAKIAALTGAQRGSAAGASDPDEFSIDESSPIQTHSNVDEIGLVATSGAKTESDTNSGEGEPELPLEARGEARTGEISPGTRSQPRDEQVQATAAINQAASAARPLTPMHAISHEVTLWLHQPMISQIARGIEMAAAQPGQAVHVRLHPEGLGAVTLEVGMAGTDVHVHIAVDNPGTRDLIQSNWNSLSNSLSDQGLSIAGAQVELSGRNSQWGSSGDQPRAWTSQGSTARESAAIDDQSGAGATLTNRSSAHGVDYRV